MKPEPTFVHVDRRRRASESRFAALYKTEPRITGSPTLLVSDYITQQPRVSWSQSRGLAIRSTRCASSSDAPTAELERAVRRAHRHLQLPLRRLAARPRELPAAGDARRLRRRQRAAAARTGVYLGAYAWVEDLRPSTAQLDARPAPAGPRRHVSPAPRRIMHDPTNGGYIHAPSLTHARTAAVLRSGYLANATRGQSADARRQPVVRPRAARALAARRHAQRSEPRRAARLPLRARAARRLTAWPRSTSSSTRCARRSRWWPTRSRRRRRRRTCRSRRSRRATSSTAASWSRSIRVERHRDLSVRPARPARRDGAPRRRRSTPRSNALLDVYDAIADLALAEGVHQAVQGNFDRDRARRSTPTRAAISRPIRRSCRRRPAGIGLTHRVARAPQARARRSRRARRRARTAEPAVDAWLAGVLPTLDEIGCMVTWTDPVGGAPAHAWRSRSPTSRCGPLDVLELVKPDDVQAMTELDDRILRFVHRDARPARRRGARDRAT